MDTYTPFKQVNIPSLHFVASRYEEYMGGKMINSGNCVLEIDCKESSTGSIICTLSPNSIDSKVSNANFDTCITLQDRLLMLSCPQKTNAAIIVVTMMQNIIGCTCQERNYTPTEPVVGSIYTENGNVVKMSFTVANPERLIELY